MTVEQILIILEEKLIFEANVFESFISFISKTQIIFSNMYCQKFRCLSCKKILFEKSKINHIPIFMLFVQN